MDKNSTPARMRVCVVGTGYVGLITGAGLAETGVSVTCVDNNASKIELLRQGKVPIYEPGLDLLIERNTSKQRLSFASDLHSALAKSNIVFIAVGTPQAHDGSADISGVLSVAESVAQAVSQETILVIKSTVPVGTNQRVHSIVQGAKHPIHVVSNPEFLKEGDAVNDFLRPDRIIIGLRSNEKYPRDVMEQLYHPVCLDHERILWVSPESAELSKYVSNAMLAARISFMNEVALLCERVGADIHEVRHGVGSDPRIGDKFLYAGPGYGGSCFPKDVSALMFTARQHDVSLELATATQKVNDRQKRVLFSKISKHFAKDLKDKNIAIWGIAFKPKTDDIRESASMHLIGELLEAGALVRAHDPEAMKAARAVLGSRVTFCENAYDTLNDADAVILVTEWREYQHPDFNVMKSKMRAPNIFDGRNIWSSYSLPSLGFHYEGIGVKTV